MNSRDLDIVGRSRLFLDFTPEIRSDVLSGAHAKDYPKGKLLIQEGDEADAFYVVLSGWIKVFRESLNGDEAVFATLTSGETVGETAWILGTPNPSNAEVVADARLVRICGDALRRRLLANPAVCLGLIAAMSKNLNRVVSEVEQLQTRSSAQRLASFLLNLSPVRQGSAVVSLPYDKALVAARLGMKPESLSRGLMRLRSLGVEADGSRLSIADAATLVEFCENRSMRCGAQVCGVGD